MSAGKLKIVTKVFYGSSQSAEPNVKVFSTNLIHDPFFPHLLKCLFTNDTIIIYLFIILSSSTFLLQLQLQLQWVTVEPNDPHRHIHTLQDPLNEGSVRRRGLNLHNTQHLRETYLHVHRRDSNLYPSKRAAADPRLRTSSHRDRRPTIQRYIAWDKESVLEQTNNQTNQCFLPQAGSDFSCFRRSIQATVYLCVTYSVFWVYLNILECNL